MPETFTDTSGWTLVTGGGVGTVSSNILTDGGKTSSIWQIKAGLSTWRDVRASAQWQSKETTGGDQSVLLGSDVDNWIGIRVDVAHGTWNLTKRIAGTQTDIATSTFTNTTNNWYWSEIEKQGTTYIAKIYSSGASPVAKSSATLVGTLSGTASDSTLAANGIMLRSTENTTSSVWGGISASPGGVYVEGWGPESWGFNGADTAGFSGHRGGDGDAFDETADAGPNGKQWAFSLKSATTSSLVYKEQTIDSLEPSTTYTLSTYMKVANQVGGAGNLGEVELVEQNTSGTTEATDTIVDAGETSWTRKTVTFTTNANTRQARLRIYSNPSGTTGSGTAYFSELQLEQGSIATPWRNAPADDDPIVWRLGYDSDIGTPTTSTSYVEAVPGNSTWNAGMPVNTMSINAFLPWDANVVADLAARNMDASATGCIVYADVQEAGTSMSIGTSPIITFVQYGTAASSAYGSGSKSLAAGKTRFATVYKVAGCATGYLGAKPQLILTATRGKFDLAEEYTVTDPTIGAGDVVQLASDNSQGASNTTIERSTGGYSSKVLGIVSSDPGITLGNFNLNGNGTISSEQSYSDRYSRTNLRPVALKGRVPVKVTNENGPIHRGDTLTSSALYPGYAMKATKAGFSIGTAMDDFDPSTNSQVTSSNELPNESEVQTGVITVFVNLSWYDPDAYLTDSGQFVISNNTPSASSGQAITLADNGLIATTSATLGASGSATVQTATDSATLTNNTQMYNGLMHYTLTNTQTNEVIDRVGAYNSLFVANLKVGSLDVSSINNNDLRIELASLSARIRNLELATSSAVLSSSISGLLASSSNQLLASSSASLDNLTILNKLTTTSLGVTGTLTNGLLSIDGLNSTITSLGDLKFNLPGGSVTIDKSGNLIISNNLTAQRVEADIFSSAKASGSSILPANTASIDVNSDDATDSAKILITPTTLTDKVLTVTNKTVGKFTVSVKQVDSQDIHFDWFIIQ